MYIYGINYSGVIVSAGLVSTDSILTSSDHELRRLGNLTKEECELVRANAAKSILSLGFIPGKILNQLNNVLMWSVIMRNILSGMLSYIAF
jgi:hypothetical protein